MERADLLASQRPDLHRPGQGPEQAVASRNVKVLVVGNPANTNAYIAMKSAPDLPAKQLHRHAAPGPQPCRIADRRQDRLRVGDIEKLCRLGQPLADHVRRLSLCHRDGKSVKDTINDHDWNANVFLPTVGKRGAAIIAARGLSSAASAANAAIDHMRDWALGTNGKWVTMGIPSKGEYGIPKEIMFGYPVTCEGGEYKIVEGLPIDAFSQECINKTLAELQGEQDGVKHLLWVRSRHRPCRQLGNSLILSWCGPSWKLPRPATPTARSRPIAW
jgi:malate dehydrogenase